MTNTAATTYAEALDQTPVPVAHHPEFSIVSYSPTAGLSSRRRTITVLLCHGVPVDRGSRGDLLAVLGHEPTRERYTATATATKLTELLTTPLTTQAEAEKWVRDMAAIGYATHPDDPGDQLIDSRTGDALFTETQIPLYDARMNEAFNLLDDIYLTSVEAWGEGLA